MRRQETRERPRTVLPSTHKARRELRAQVDRAWTWMPQLRVGVKKIPKYHIWGAGLREKGDDPKEKVTEEGGTPLWREGRGGWKNKSSDLSTYRLSARHLSNAAKESDYTPTEVCHKWSTQTCAHGMEIQRQTNQTKHSIRCTTRQRTSYTASKVYRPIFGYRMVPQCYA